MGKFIGELSRITFLSDDITTLIKEINNYRTFIAHKLFQNNIVTGNLCNSKTVHEYTDNRLIPMTNKATAINKMIADVIASYRDDLHLYKAQVGPDF